jgi:putative transcriptional regulator
MSSAEKPTDAPADAGDAAVAGAVAGSAVPEAQAQAQGQPGINLTNQFLIAMPGMDDQTFSGTVVYLCEHTERGALGLVINKPIDIKVKNLFEKVDLSLNRDELGDQPVYFGGPVQTERGFVLHEAVGGHYNSSLEIPGGLEMTTSRDVLEALSHGAGPRKVHITLGYAGWGAGQLEDELSRNGWLNVSADPAVIFDTPVEQRYAKALALLGVDPAMLSQEAGHA